jgi:hypothetical protein
MSTVTGQCDHIIGWIEVGHPEYGGMDRLAGMEDIEDVTDRFNYCPMCGLSIDKKSGN